MPEHGPGQRAVRGSQIRAAAVMRNPRTGDPQPLEMFQNAVTGERNTPLMFFRQALGCQ